MKYPKARIIDETPKEGGELLIPRRRLVALDSDSDLSRIRQSKGTEFEGYGYFLLSEYDWVIVQTSLGTLALVPLRPDVTK